MNTLGLALLAAGVRCLVLAALGAALCLASRRRGPATGAFAAQATLTALAAVAVLAPCSWPRWYDWSPITPRFARAVPVARAVASTVSDRISANPTLPSAKDSLSGPETALDATTFAMFLEQFRTTVGRSRQASGWRWPAWLALGYLLCAGVLLARLACGLVAVARLRKRSAPIADPALLELLAQLRAELGLTVPVELRATAEVSSPATVGWRKPAILIPAGWRQWSQRERRAVLGHELVHVRRGDYAAGLWARLCVILNFYQPLAHWLAGRLRLEQELTADGWGARLSGGNGAYLQILAGMALRREVRPVAWPARTFFPLRGTLTRRIEMLRDGKAPVEMRPRRRSVCACAVTLAVASVLLAGLRGPVPLPLGSAQAQERPPQARAADPTGPQSLEAVPADAGLVLTVRPAELLARPEYQALGESLAPGGPVAGQLGIAPAKVEQLTLVWLRQEAPGAGRRSSQWLLGASAAIVRAFDDQDLNALAAAIVPHAEEEEFAGQRFFRTRGDGNRPAVARLGDRTMVISPSPRDLRRYITARLNPSRTHAWDDAWSTARKGQAAAAVDAAYVVQLLEPSLTGPNRAQLDAFAPLWTGAHAHAVGIDLAKGLALDLASTCSSDEQAVRVSKTLNAVLTLAGNALPGLRQRCADSPREVTTLLAAADELLQSAEVERQGRTVRLHATAQLDAAGLIKGAVVPALSASRSAARRTQSVNHMKQLALAMHNYLSQHGHFPPAVVIGPDGKTPHSWRVALLPYLEQNDLYKRYKLDEPWDSPSNLGLLRLRPEVFGYPGSGDDSTDAAYFVLVGPGTIFPPGGKGTTIQEIIDGTSNTIMLVEAKRPIPWTKPEDIPFDPTEAHPAFGGYQPESQGFNVAFADGSVRFIKDSVDPKVLKALITCNGREVVGGF